MKRIFVIIAVLLAGSLQLFAQSTKMESFFRRYSNYDGVVFQQITGGSRIVSFLEKEYGDEESIFDDDQMELFAHYVKRLVYFKIEEDAFDDEIGDRFADGFQSVLESESFIDISDEDDEGLVYVRLDESMSNMNELFFAYQDDEGSIVFLDLIGSIPLEDEDY